MATQSQGARRVRLDLQDFISRRHEAALEVARDEWQWTRTLMPALQFVDAYETEVIDDTPQLSINVAQLAGMTQVDIDTSTGAEIYEARYDINLHLWLKQKEPRNALALRDDYTTVIRSMVLGVQGLDASDEYRVNPTTLRETYSDLSRVKGDRYLAAGRVSFTVARTESLWRAEGWYAETIEIPTMVLSYQIGGGEE